MKAIVKRELLQFFKNYLIWAGVLIVIFGMCKNLMPYLQIRYFESEEELQNLPLPDTENKNDVDVMDGYLPASAERQKAQGLLEIERVLEESMGYSRGEIKKIMEPIFQTDCTISEITAYLEQYQFYGANYIFEELSNYKGTKEEVNGYIGNMLEQQPFTYYFSRKFADFAGLYMGFFSMILLAFLYRWDIKRDIYELLHTKPVKAGVYVIGKVLGGFLMMAAVLFTITTFFNICCIIHGRKANFPVNPFDLYIAAAWYILPNILMIVSIYTVISILFKNPLPAIPLLFLYMIYSNMGSVGGDGVYGYYGRPLAIMVRFPGGFFTATTYLTDLNQVFLLLCSCLLIGVSIFIWGKRRGA